MDYFLVYILNLLQAYEYSNVLPIIGVSRHVVGMSRAKTSGLVIGKVGWGLIVPRYSPTSSERVWGS
jgi:hypothetical protein